MRTKKYRKRPIVVEAIRYTDDIDKNALLKWLGRDGYFREDGALVIRTLEGEMVAPIGHYIVKGIKGEAYPVAPDIFERTYEEVSAPS